MNDIFNQLLSLLNNVKMSGKDSFTARCPAHDDNSNSLSVSRICGKV
jgi:DNA primase